MQIRPGCHNGSRPDRRLCVQVRPVMETGMGRRAATPWLRPAPQSQSDTDRDRGAGPQPSAGPERRRRARLSRSSVAPSWLLQKQRGSCGSGGGSLLRMVSGDGRLVHCNVEQTLCEDLVNLRTERTSWPARLESAVVPCRPFTFIVSKMSSGLFSLMVTK